ncbi:MAG: hypothetical protein COB37_05500 [Kordiimonadales bacterium]|nr:MAG: hypothetical protein COB37_05500 [Kordiimonadales bacterium]
MLMSRKTAKIFSRKIHKWLALVIGVQFFLWFISGFYMVTVPIEVIHGDHLIKPVVPTALSATDHVVTVASLRAEYPAARSLQLKTMLGKAYYVVRGGRDSLLIDAETGAVISPLDEATIAALAAEIYDDGAAVRQVIALDHIPAEVRGRSLPLWRVDYDDINDSAIYFSGSTGDQVGRRHDLWRAFDFLWMLHIMDYENREDINSWLLIIATALGLTTALSGAWMLFYSFTRKPQPADFTPRMSMRYMRFLHKWLGLLIGAQVILWVGSGLFMSLIDDSKAHGRGPANRPAPLPMVEQPAFVPAAEIITASTDAVHRVTLRRVFNRYVYQTRGTGGIRQYDAITGRPYTVTAAEAEAMALADYAGAGAMQPAVLVNAAENWEARDGSGPTWAIAFADADETMLYFDQTNGRLAARYTNDRRLFDTVWMLHMMDYPRAESFNHVWNIIFGFIAVWIGLSGFLLIFKVFRRQDFGLKPVIKGSRAKA